MRKKLIFALSVALLLFVGQPNEGQANTKDATTKFGAFQLLQKGFEAQVSLLEKPRSKEEIYEILTPFFSKEYIEAFWERHIFKVDKGYILLGTDMLDYIVPFFSFDQKTKHLFNPEKNRIYVYEWFPKETYGPVIWEGHFEGLELAKNNGKWKINNYMYSQTSPALAAREKTES